MSDVQDTLKQALEETGLNQASVVHHPHLLSDNGPCYFPGELAEYLEGKGVPHTSGASYRLQTQGKIDCLHQTLKNCILLEHNILPGDLETQIAAFVGHYNHERNHQSLHTLTQAEIYTGRGHTIPLVREKQKRNP